MRPAAVLLLAALPAAAQQLPSIPDAISAKNWFFERAVHPETKLIYSRVNLDDPDLWKNASFAAPDSVRGKSNNDSEVPNLSNCAGAGGVFLGQLADIYAATGDKECVRQARVVFSGLESLAAASPRRGFIARGLLPEDASRAHFHNSSVDQYTFYVYGLYKYFHSGLAAEAEKASMRRIMHDICTMLERDGTILGSNGAPGWVSDIEAIRSDRSSRLLQMYLVGHAITGDPHWRDVYLEKLREARYGRLRTVLDPMQLRYTYVPRDLARGAEHADLGTIWQTQYSLVPLFELETELPLKTAWLEALRTAARIAERYGSDGPEVQIIMLAQNRDVVSEVTTPAQLRTNEDLKRRTAALISRTPRWQVDMPRGNAFTASMTHFGLTWVGVMDAYWTGIVRRVFTP
jgi:hypothetical protein